MAAAPSHFIESYHLLAYDTLDSTNEEAKRLAEAGDQHGAVIWAKRQTEGRGRQGRRWISKEGNLYCSLLLKPEVPRQHLPQLSFVTSLAVLQALEAVVGEGHTLALKWPNDLLVDGRKIAGLLLETHEVAPSTNPWVVIGLGINVNHHPGPEDVRFPADSLHALGVDIVSPKIILARVLDFFQAAYDRWSEQGFEVIRRDWLAFAAWLGQAVVLRQGETRYTGIFHDLDSHGALVLQEVGESPVPVTRTFTAGDVSLESGHDATDD